MIDFTSIYNKHIDQLFAFGSRLTTDREMLKDCIQDVFVKLYTRRESLDKVVNLESYLYISLRNRINDEYRRNVRLKDDEISDAHMSDIAENDAFLQQRQEHQNELTAKMENFFTKLSPRQCQIISLYYYEQRKYDEICQIMGINYQSVRNLMHRSISRLRECAQSVRTAE